MVAGVPMMRVRDYDGRLDVGWTIAVCPDEEIPSNVICGSFRVWLDSLKKPALHGEVV